MKQTLLLLICLSLMPLCMKGQREEIDSLQQVVKKDIADSLAIKVYHRLGKLYINVSADSSESYVEQVLQLAKKTSNIKYEAEGYTILGVLEKNRANYEKALQYHLKSLRLKEQINDENGQAVTHNDLGVLFKITGRIDDALKHYKRSNELCIKVGNAKGVAMTYNNLGTIFREKRNLDSALYYYNLALKQSEAMEDTYSIATCLSNIGDAYSELGRDDEALKIFIRCLTYDKANEDKTGMAVSYNNIARALGALKQFDKALLYSDSAIALTFVEKLQHERVNSYFIRSFIEDWKGDYAAALKFHRNAAALRDSLMNEETNQQLSELQTKYETEKKEQKIALQEAELNKKNYLMAGIVAAMVLLLLLFYSYYRRYKLQQQARLQQEIIHQQELATNAVIEAEERERKRIASDLHDGVGQLMSAAKMNLSMVGSELSFGSQEQKNAFDKAMSLVDEGCREVRTVSHNIMPNALLKSGLSSAIREFINKIDQRVIEVNLYTEGLKDRINGNTESVLYRIVQECVNNVIKHAAATNLDISLIKDEEGISLSIEDNGKGFDASDTSRYDGIGMKNIKTRVDYLKGTVEWDSSPGKGTVVMIHVPG